MEHNALDKIRRILQENPAGPQPEEVMRELDMACRVAADLPVPEDAVELGPKALEWWIASGIGFVPQPCTELLDKWIGRQAIEGVVAQAGDEWEVDDCSCGECLGYSIKNFEMLARRYAPPQDSGGSMVVLIMIEEEPAMIPGITPGVMELLDRLYTPATPPTRRDPYAPGEASSSAPLSWLMEALRGRGPFRGM